MNPTLDQLAHKDNRLARLRHVHQCAPTMAVDAGNVRIDVCTSCVGLVEDILRECYDESIRVVTVGAS